MEERPQRSELDGSAVPGALVSHSVKQMEGPAFWQLLSALISTPANLLTVKPVLYFFSPM
jgi:hypothetical protein